MYKVACRGGYVVKVKFSLLVMVFIALVAGCIDEYKEPDLPIVSGTPLSPSGAAAMDPAIAVDASGNAMSVWGQGNRLYASRYDASSPNTIKWQAAISIDAGTEGDAEEPAIGVDASGNYTVVWTQWDATGGESNIWANRYVAGTGWGTPVKIEAKSGSADRVDLAVNDSGQAMAVWIQANCGPGDKTKCVWQNRFVPGIGAGTGWQGEDPVETETLLDSSVTAKSPGLTRNAYKVVVAMNAGGMAQVVWEKSSQMGGDDYHDIKSRHYNGGSGAAVEFVESSNDMAHSPNVVIDTAGNATAVWKQGGACTVTPCPGGSSFKLIWSNRYAVGSGWGSRLQLENQDGEALTTQIGVDAGNNVTAVWVKGDSVWSKRYVDGTGWDATAQKVALNGSGFNLLGNPLSLAVEPTSGRITVAFTDNAGDVWANRFTSGTWGGAFGIEANPGAGKNPVVATNDSGVAMAVWSQVNGKTYSILDYRF